MIWNFEVPTTRSNGGDADYADIDGANGGDASAHGDDDVDT